MTPTTWVIGRSDRPEFSPVLALLRDFAGPTNVRDCLNIPAALAAGTDSLPDLVVVLQSHPDEYSAEEIAGLLRIAPIARRIIVAGAWCEADGRRRNLWPTAVRVPAAWAVERLQAEWTLLTTGQGTPLPLTATRDECFTADYSPADRDLTGLVVCVDSPDRAWRETQQAHVKQAGGQVADDPAEANLLWLDGDPWETAGKARTGALHATHPALPILVSLDFPLPELVADVLAAGGIAVLPKLAPWSHVVHRLESLALSPEEAPPR